MKANHYAVLITFLAATILASPQSALAESSANNAFPSQLLSGHLLINTVNGVDYHFVASTAEEQLEISNKLKIKIKPGEIAVDTSLPPPMPEAEQVANLEISRANLICNAYKFDHSAVSLTEVGFDEKNVPLWDVKDGDIYAAKTCFAPSDDTYKSIISTWAGLSIYPSEVFGKVENSRFLANFMKNINPETNREYQLCDMGTVDKALQWILAIRAYKMDRAQIDRLQTRYHQLANNVTGEIKVARYFKNITCVKNIVPPSEATHK